MGLGAGEFPSVSHDVLAGPKLNVDMGYGYGPIDIPINYQIICVVRQGLFMMMVMIALYVRHKDSSCSGKSTNCMLS